MKMNSNPNTTYRHSSPPRARGVAMVMVMIALTVGTIITLSFLASQTTSTAIAHNATRQVQARAIAEDAMRLVIEHLRATPEWRDDHTHGLWSSSTDLSGGGFRVMFADEEDSDLGDDVSEPFVVTVEASYNGVVHRVSNRIVPTASSAGITVLLVTGNAYHADEDLERIAVIESWGYSVLTVTDSDGQSVYDAAAAQADVIYVSEESASGSVSTKLNGYNIGVVNEEQALQDELKMSTSGGNWTGSTIDITDNTHPITAGFATGDLQITANSTGLIQRGGTAAAGLTVLAERQSSSTAVLTVLDVGDTMTDGNPSPQRRVTMPFGSNAFEYGQLNDDGKKLMKQAIDWAAGEASISSGFAWHTDFDSDPTAADGNSDSVNDFTVRGGSSFSTSSLNGGVWTSSQTLDTDPQYDFATPTTAYARMRNQSVGGRGVVIWVNFDYAPDDSSFAPIYASLMLQTDGTQTLKVHNKNNSGELTLFEETGIAAGYVEVQLDMDPVADTVGVWVDGEYHGPFDYQTKTPNSGELAQRMATALAWGSTAQFDTFTVTPNATLYDPTGGQPNVVVSYDFIEPDPIAPQLVSHWKLDETSSTNTFIEVDGEVVIEAENYSTLTPGTGNGASSSWNTTTDNSPSGGTALIAEPNAGKNMGLTTNGPRLDYPITFTTPGTYRVWVRMIGSTGVDDSVHVGLDGTCLTNARGYGLSPGGTSWNWEDDVASGDSNISFTIPAAGTYTFNLWMREDGVLIDKIVLNTDASQPSGSGPVESETGGTAVDDQGVSNGSFQGAPTAGVGGFGDGATAVDFNGSDQFVAVPHQADYLVNEGTFAFWFYPSDVSGTQTMLSKDATNWVTGGHIRIYLSGSRVQCRLQSATTSYTVGSSSGTISANTWHHVAVGFGPGGLRIYLDGVLVDSDSYAGGLGTSSGDVGNEEPMLLGADLWQSSSGTTDGWNKPYHGRLDDIRLYDRNLNADQVGDLRAQTQPRAVAPAVVYDTSGNSPAHDLSIADPDHITWISGGGITLDTATTISSAGPVDRLHTAITQSDAVTVEAVFTPANITQDGPARIVSYSNGTSNRNFHLGQTDAKYNVRLRTEFNTSGTPEAESGDVLVADTKEHVVFTYDPENEELRVYRNGTLEITEPWTGDLDNWNDSYELLLANEVGGSRGWLGTLHRVAIYDGTVNGIQADNLFDGNPPCDGTGGEEGLAYQVEWLESP